MMVGALPECPLDEDCRVARPASSLRVSLRMASGIAHQIGYILGGLRHFQVCPHTPWDKNYVTRMRVWRDPQCEYLDAHIIMDFVNAQQGAEQVQGQAGSGAVQTVLMGSGGESRMFVMRLPWDSYDSDYQNVTLTFTDCAARSVSIWDVPRDDLDLANDHGADLLDADHTAIGLTEARAVAESDEAGPDQVTAAVNDTWDDHRRTGVTWWTPEDWPLSVSAAAWTNPFGTFVFVHRARQRTASETSRYYRPELRTKADSGATYDLRVSSSGTGDSVSAAGLTYAAYTWKVLEDLEIDTTADDDITVEIRRTAGAGTIYLNGFSCGEAVNPEV